MRNKFLRVVIVIATILGVVFLANGSVAWADSDTGTDALLNVELEQVDLSVSPAKGEPGSVKPPPPIFFSCKNGTFSVGGIAIVKITDLKPGYCVRVELWNPIFQIRRIPDGAGSVLARMGFLRIFYLGRLVHDIPAADGAIEVCYAVPPEKQTQLYFYDFYGLRFKKITELPNWEAINTVVENNIACSSVQNSGVYALFGN